ncbi:MAG: BTAD domain-containing putative transcriptional regulator [bacterium]
MQVPVFSAKLTIPTVSAAYLARPRLDELWQEWENKRLVLVTAGAGFGKTSFLAANARTSERPCSWYSLDEMDAELATFCAHLRQAVSAPEVDGVADESTTAADFMNRELSVLVRTLRNEIRGRVIVLDDVQLIAGSAEILHFLEQLIKFLPQSTTLVLAAREPVAVATMKLQALGSVVQITAEDLQFRSEEVIPLYGSHFPDTDLDPRLARKIVAQTEGWAAGIEIFFQVLGGTSARRIEDALARILAMGSGWFAYFAEEVVGSLDSDTRDFLYRSSVLPRLEPELCDRVLGLENSRLVLEELCRRNLFTFSVEDDIVAYRYHHLFHDFLRDQLRRHLNKGEIHALQRRAATELKRAGAWAEAAVAYAEAGDPRATLKLVEKQGEKLLATGRYEIIRRALDSVPKQLFNKSGSALFVLGRVAEIKGEWEEAEKLYLKALRLVPGGTRRVELLSLIAQLKLRRGMYNASRNLCHEALAEPGRKSAWIRSRILNMLGVAACELGKLDEAEDYLDQALKVCRRSKDEESLRRTLYLLPGNLYYRRGDFQRAKEAARKALVVFKRSNDPRRICHSLGVLAYVTGEAGEEREARELASEALRLAESIEYRVMEAYCQFTLGRCALITGDLAQAQRHFEVSLNLGEQLGEPGLLTIPHLGLAERALAAGELRVARRHAQDGLANSLDVKDPYQEAQSRLLLGVVAALDNPDDPDQASRFWRQAEKIMRRVGTYYDLHRLLLIRLDEGAVPDDELPAVFAELLAGILSLQHDFLLLVMEPERAARVLPRALSLGFEPEYLAKKLVQLGERAIPHLAELVSHGEEAVRCQAVDILLQIGGSQAQVILGQVVDDSSEAGRVAREAAEELASVPGVPLRIRALGGLSIDIGDVQLTFADWKSTRALRLFQLLLVYRFRWVPRDVVLEELWPDADPRRGVNNLRQTIHVLRKTLEPDLEEARNSLYIRYRNEAIRLEPGVEHFYDVEDFEESMRLAETCWNGGKLDEAGKHLTAAEALYRGAFMEETPYEEFVTIEREQLRDRLLRGVKRLTGYLADNEQWSDLIPLCRRALSQNPYHEDFYRHLVEAQFELGNRREALADFHQYEEMMVREMDLLPSARMKALADKVVALGRTDSA